ncbi:hypothetical protein M9Y10_031794 [Tritrichomonas musculus]|uniref:Protein kinase domain-containing protein n=1 Tax=Tritrichomonas musculus TaxID=1915356 RepID=A0ABR2GZW2_9EUKA
MNDIEQITTALSQHGYEYIKTIGNGASSKVFLCKSEKYNHLFAIKCVENNTLKSSEYNALASLNHPYIIKLYKSFQDHDLDFLVMEYCPNDTLKHKKKLDYNKFVYYAKQILEALSYCHSQKIAHRDIKPDNIFLDNYDHVKLADFGLSKYFEPNKTSNEKCGSLMYSSPEMINQIPFDPFRADIWSLGITFFYMATGKFPFSAKTYDDLLRLVKFGQINFSNVEINLSIKSLIQKMTSKNPKFRPTVDEILKLPIFNEYKAPRLAKIVSMGQIYTRGKTSRDKHCLYKPSSSFSDDQEDENIPLSRSHTYKSAITHSFLIHKNVSSESLLIHNQEKQ